MPEYIKDMLTVIQTISSLAACILAFWIPKKIKWEQIYSQLLTDYCGYDFGAAVMGIVLFFHNDCKNQIENIQKCYKKRFASDFYGTDDNKTSISNDKNLHLQRRLLVQFYCQLDLCARSIFIGKRRVQKDFSSKEANLLKILYYMNEAANEEPIFLDISTDERIRNDKNGINSYISHIYILLKGAPEYIRQ